MRIRLFAVTFALVGGLGAMAQTVPRETHPVYVGATGIWALRAGGFTGGGGAIRFGTALGAMSHLELEGIGLFQTAHNTLFNEQASVESRITTLYDTSAALKTRMNRGLLMANYRFEYLFDTSILRSVAFYVGAGAGFAYSSYECGGSSSVAIFTQVNTVITPGAAVPGSLVSTRIQLWSGAAQVFAGLSAKITQKLSLTAGGRILFTPAQTIAPYNQRWIQSTVKSRQGFLEVGLSYSF